VRDPRVAGAGDERKREEVEEMFTGDEELRAAGNRATARNYRRRRVHEERSGARASGGRTGVRSRCSGSAFIECGGGGRGPWPGHWPSMAIGVGGLDCNQGMALN
jgi:hypothetical protein